MAKRVHLIGIGGIGISALARYFLSQNWTVSGSDITPSQILDALKKDGAEITIGHKTQNVNSKINLVVYNQAIPADNPELKAARKLGVPCYSYPEAVGELTNNYKTIAIAGAHGKSTTTALTALVLIAGGIDPTVIIGTKLKEFGNTNFRAGKSKWLVLEADEWKGSFWHYSPTIAVVTNIDKEHLDFYKTFAGVKQGFQKFIKNIRPDGALFINKGYSNVLKNIRVGLRTVILFSKSDRAAAKIKKVLQIPGEHNVLNGLAAYHIGRHLGIPEKTILKALASYQGAWRRLEYRGDLQVKIESKKVLKAGVYDDYAHHPTEIRATLAGMRQKWPKNSIICVFQAHQVQRLKLLFRDFLGAFKAADKVIILPTYEVAGREVSGRVSSKQKVVSSKADLLGKKLAKAIGATYVENPKKELRVTLENLLITNHHLLITIVMMGAGNIVNYTDLVVRA